MSITTQTKMGHDEKRKLTTKKCKVYMDDFNVFLP